MKKTTIIILMIYALLGLMLPCAAAEDPLLLPPGSPGQITISGIEENRATVSWAPVSTATQYTVWVDGQRWNASSYPGAEITGLLAYAEYTVYVTASNDAGESGYSSSVEFTTLPPIPTTPNRPEILELRDTTATIQWDPLPGWQYIEFYRIYLNGQVWADVEPGEGMQTADLTSLTTGNHSVSIAGINANQEGPVSGPLQFTIQAIPAPTGLKMANRSDEQVILTWDKVLEADRYKVFLDGSLIGETKENTCLIGGLDSDVEYPVSVRAVMTDGNESAEAALAVRTALAPVPITLASVMSSTYDYVPDVIPGMIVVLVIGGAMKIARTGKTAIGKQPFTRRV